MGKEVADAFHRGDGYKDDHWDRFYRVESAKDENGDVKPPHYKEHTDG